ncbi:MAG: dolichyl-phosphate beta-glucosyltransferase [Acidobacteriota bacterium]
MSLSLSVVIPAFNEAERLGPTLERIASYLEEGSGSWEILVVDDGSRDATVAVAEAAGDGVRVLRQPENRGKGAALRRGVGESRGDRVLLCDADLSTPIEDLARLIPAVDAGAALAMGSRAVSGSRIEQRQPLYRELMGKTFNGLIRLFGVRGFRDTQCGFKLLDGAVARQLFEQLKTDGFAFDVELVWLALRAGHEVVEVGVRWSNSADSRVHPILDSSRMLRDILRMRWRHRGRSRHRAP